MARWALGLQYTGTQYIGWQSQPGQPASIQQQLETALSFVANHAVTVTCAGRTDAGVHALEQVVHFDSSVERPARAWILGTNTRLPADISVQWAQPVADSFHARFKATYRRYQYIIYNAPQRPAVYFDNLTWYLAPLALAPMQQAAEYFLGEHDFNALRSSQCQARHAVRTLQQLQVKQLGRLFIIEVQANAFLHHMVRNIAGVLLAVGCGKQPSAWAQRVLQSRDRRQAGVTAPASGLYLTEVGYPEVYLLPKQESNPFFLPVGLV